MANKFLKKLTFGLTSSALLLAGMVSGVNAYEAGKDYKYIVLHVNDTHGHFWKDNLGQGGFPAIATIVKEVKFHNPDTPVLVLHAGDVFTGVPESDIQNAEPDIIGMNLIGFDAWAVGNHEFDTDYAGMQKAKALSKVPMISANIFHINPDSGKLDAFYDPYVFLKKGDLSFLVVGTTTPSTKYQANPEYTKDFAFIDPAEAFKAAIDNSEQKNGKADVIISLSHLGYYARGDHGNQPYGDTILAQKLPKNKVALYITGHTHVPGCVDANGDQAWPAPGEKCTVPYSNGSPLVQAVKWGEYVGKAEFSFKDGVSTLTSYELIPVNLKKKIYDYSGKKVYIDAWAPVMEDKEVYDALKPYHDKGNAQLLVKVGELDGDLKTSRTEATKLGWLAAKAQLQATQADIAIVNSGGLRTSLEAGDISYRDILQVQPFRNTLVTVDFDAQELVAYLESIAFKANGGFPNFAGVTFEANPKTGKITNVLVNGQALSDDRTYKVVLFSFLASGGDGYPSLKDHRTYLDTGYNDAQALRDYFIQNKVIKVSELKVEGAH